MNIVPFGESRGPDDCVLERRACRSWSRKWIGSREALLREEAALKHLAEDTTAKFRKAIVFDPGVKFAGLKDAWQAWKGAWQG